MKSMVRSALGFIICLSFFLAACSGDSEQAIDSATVRPEAPSPVVSSTLPPIPPNRGPMGPIARPGATPTPAVGLLSDADLLVPKWQKLGAAPTNLDAGERLVYNEPYFVELATGDIYRLVQDQTFNQATSDPSLVQRNLVVDRWSETLGAIVSVSARVGYTGEYRANIYAAAPGEPFKLFASSNTTWGSEIVFDGTLMVASEQRLDTPNKVRSAILNPQTFTPVQVFDDLTPSSHSRDGTVLALQSDAETKLYRLNSATQRYELVFDRLMAWTPQVWSNYGHRLLIGEDDDATDTYSTVAINADDGSRVAFAGGAGSGAWSPDDRLVALEFNRNDPKDPQGIAVFDAATGKALLRVSGAWLVGWQDNDTVVFTGNLCDTFDAMRVDVDGSGLETLAAGPDIAWTQLLTPDRRTLIYGSWTNGLTTTLNLRDLGSGATRRIDVGGLSLYGRPQLLADGRFLILHPPPGKDGPCYGQDVKPEYTQVEVVR